jgi:hypothetical protein
MQGFREKLPGNRLGMGSSQTMNGGKVKGITKGR